MKENKDISIEDTVKALQELVKPMNDGFVEKVQELFQTPQKDFDEIEVVETPKMDFKKLNKMLSKPSRKNRKKK